MQNVQCTDESPFETVIYKGKPIHRVVGAPLSAELEDFVLREWSNLRSVGTQFEMDQKVPLSS